MKHPLPSPSGKAATRIRSITASLLALPLVSALPAQDLPYSSGSTGADGPLSIPIPIGARYNHSMAFDVEAGRMVIFGGYNPNTGYVGDTVIRTTPNWGTINPASAPSPRTESAMVYDAARKEIVLFGGYTSNNGRSAETWVWKNNNWALKTPATSPPARSSHAMAYDSVRQKIVLFGGQGAANLNDTWEWDGSNWTQLNPADRPAGRSRHAMAYHAGRQRTVLFGGDTSSADTWEWNGANWQQISATTSPPGLYDHAMAYDPVRQEIVLYGGYHFMSDVWTYGNGGWTKKAVATDIGGRHDHQMAYDPVAQKIVLTGGNSPGNSFLRGTYLWDGTDWTLESDSVFVFDMATKPDGVWNYTTINVPEGVMVNFRKNLLNAPVQWLATGAVNIHGTLNLAGNPGGPYTNVESGAEAMGGAGGYDGGLGGRQFSVSGSYIGSAGGGPGGGAPGNQSEHGKEGRYNGVYGNTFIQPLIGGSGGGGGSSTDTANGGNGGGGGGAILIASSADITVNGLINVNGGAASSGSYSGGAGSGGAIRLIADRVLGNGVLAATNGHGITSGGVGGRIRIEGYYRPLAADPNVSPSPSSGPPTETFAGIGGGTGLTIASVDGVNVRQPPQGSTANPDVIFADAGSITITVAGTNIPDGTPVTVRLATSNGVMSLPESGAPAVTMNGGTASFTATVPAGVGTIQAYATVPLTQNP